MASSEKFVHEGEEASNESDKEEEEEDEWSNKSRERSHTHNSFPFSPGKEKQISVDPMSLKQPPSKPKFVSASLPCSAASSPDFSSSLPKSFKNWGNPAPLPPHPAFPPSLACQHSAVQSQSPQNQKGMFLPRSKSCGDGRSSQPSDEFDILSRHRKVIGQHQAGVLASESSSKGGREEEVEVEVEEEFKCGALCLFLPGLAKKKEEVRLHKQTNHETKDGEDDDVDAGDEENEESRSVASRGASLEKFECASWSSAAFADDMEDDHEGGVNAYFDLPLELIRGSCDNAHSPVRTAFVFDRERKGGLKKSTSKSGARKSHEASNRHVRFSTSTPSSFPPSPTSGCVTPKFFQATEFSAALLEAQNAYINF